MTVNKEAFAPSPNESLESKNITQVTYAIHPSSVEKTIVVAEIAKENKRPGKVFQPFPEVDISPSSCEIFAFPRATIIAPKIHISPAYLGYFSFGVEPGMVQRSSA